MVPLPERPAADTVPDAREAAGLSVGIGPPDGVEDAPAAPVIQVRLRHGDLGYARDPVLVGHYEGDSIVSAERALDERLGHLLEERNALGLYPGRLGTHAVFFNERAGERPAGALVLGLGQVGELAPGLLEAGVRDTLIEYALRIGRWPDDRFGPVGTVRSAAVSCLLVGSGAGGIGVADSVKAILRGAVAAADRLAASGFGERVAIDRLEFLEIYHDLAITAARALEQALTDGHLAARIAWERRVIRQGEGGQRRVRCEEAPEWWQRLEIVQEAGGDGGGGVLRFIATTDRARAEVTLAAGQLRLAEVFIAQASRSDAANTEAARTLFEMLLPNRLRELAPRQGNLVLLVDETAARFPWELLEDRWSQSGRPPAIAAGMVRQLKSARYRTHAALATGPRAFVVGNPSLDGWEGFADLPGAREEANRVAALLCAGGYQVRDAIDEPADAILAGLHRDAWRILHLAGHGEHEYPLTPAAAAPCPVCGQAPAPRAQRCSGMLIGPETFLTPGDVEQLRWVPELVFINCCHLGKTLRAQAPSLPRLAANLAVQFIRMGVRAVIAAGWAVNDQASLTFAECFYTRMLAGDPFGEAVRAAREETWRHHPDANTWGAYQCYGDPGYRLVAGSQARASTPRPAYHDPGELIADLANLTQSIRMQVRARGEADPAALDAQRTAIEDLLTAVPDTERAGWYARADLAAALGLAWGETGDSARAVDWLERALAAETGDCPLAALERCAEFKVLLVRDEWLGLHADRADLRTEDRRQALAGRVGDCIGELALMCRRAATPERLERLANACRYLAWLQSDSRARRESLADMAAYLEQALAKSDDGDSRLFPLWAAARVLTADPADPSEWRARLALDLRAMLAEATRRDQEEPSFATALAVAENETALLLTAAEVPPGTAERIGARYQAALRGGASPREAAMVREFLDFLIALGEGLPPPVRTALGLIRAGL